MKLKDLKKYLIKNQIIMMLRYLKKFLPKNQLKIL